MSGLIAEQVPDQWIDQWAGVWWSMSRCLMRGLINEQVPDTINHRQVIIMLIIEQLLGKWFDQWAGAGYTCWSPNRCLENVLINELVLLIQAEQLSWSFRRCWSISWPVVTRHLTHLCWPGASQHQAVSKHTNTHESSLCVMSPYPAPSLAHKHFFLSPFEVYP